MAVKVHEATSDTESTHGLDPESLNGIMESDENAAAADDDSEDWVAALIEGADLGAIHEALSESISDAAKAHRKWSKAEERYGGKLRALRDDFEYHQSNTQRLFSAATRGLA